MVYVAIGGHLNNREMQSITYDSNKIDFDIIHLVCIGKKRLPTIMGLRET